MTPISKIYDQVSGLLAQLEPEKIMAIQATSEIQSRFDKLVEKSKSKQISRREKDELNHFIVLERLFRLSKIRTHIAQKSKK